MNLIFIFLPIAIILFGIFFVLLTRARNYRKNVISEKYEEVRDKVTVREKKPKKEVVEEFDVPGIGLGQLVSLLVGIGVTLPVGLLVMDQVKNTVNTIGLPAEVIPQMGSMFSLVTVAVIVIIGVIISAFTGFRD